MLLTVVFDLNYQLAVDDSPHWEATVILGALDGVDVGGGGGHWWGTIAYLAHDVEFCLLEQHYEHGELVHLIAVP